MRTIQIPDDCPFEFDIYRSSLDGTWVVHVETPAGDRSSENEHGPICRVYLNDGDPLWANPELPADDSLSIGGAR